MSDAPITVQEYIEVKRALAESQCQVKQLIQTNQDLKQEITLLQNMVRLRLAQTLLNICVCVDACLRELTHLTLGRCVPTRCQHVSSCVDVNLQGVDMSHTV